MSDILSVSEELIPFLNRNDSTRIQMASNQMKQAISLTKPEVPLIKSGNEAKYTKYTSSLYIAKLNGECIYNDSYIIIIKYEDGTGDVINVDPQAYLDFDRTVISNIRVNQKFKKNDILAYTRNINKDTGELMLGKNLLVGFISMGWTFEDAVIVSESCAKKMAYRRVIKNRLELDKDMVLLNLNDYGYMPVKGNGTIVKKGDILFKIGFYKEDSLLSLVADNYKEIKAESDGIFYYDIKIRKEVVPHLLMSNWLKKKIKEQKIREYHIKEELNTISNSEKFIYKYCYLDSRKKISSKIATIDYYIITDKDLVVGSKLANRHGNKGIISKILPDNEMPKLKDGTCLDVVLNPLGVISRMNLGQLYEIHLSWIIHLLIKNFKDLNSYDFINKCLEIITIIDNTKNKEYTQKTLQYIKSVNIDELAENIKLNGLQVIQPPFESCTYDQLKTLYSLLNKDTFTETVVFNDNRMLDCSVGYMYMFRLHHEPDHKIFARSIGVYGKHNQAPSGTNAHRLGEMEVDCLLAYEAYDTIKEFMSIKADNVEERNRLFKHLFDNKANLYQPLSLKTSTLETFQTYLKAVGIEVTFDE